MGKAAMTMARTPKRLEELFGGAGFRIGMVVSRAEQADVDPGAYVPNYDEPFTKDEEKKIEGLVASYEATDPSEQDTGERVEPPPTPAEAWAKKNG